MSTTATPTAAETEPRTRLPARQWLWTSALTLACLALYLYHGIGEQYYFLTTGFDLGIFDQAVRAYAHFQAPMVALKGPGYNIFGDHFHPIIAVLAPFYWLWDSPYVLIIGQAVLMALSVPVVVRFALRRTTLPMSLAIGAVYGFGWPVLALIDFDFHEVAFATPLLALAIDALDRRKDRPLLIWSLLLLLVREDMGILVLLLGVLRIVQDAPRDRSQWRTYEFWSRRRLGVALIGLGAVTYELTTAWIIPHFAAGHGFSYGGQFDALGDSVGSAAVNAVRHPTLAFRVLFTPQAKYNTMEYLFFPLLLIPLRSRYVVLALPLLAERFLNSRANLWQAHFHYNALPWLILVLAFIDGAARLRLFSATRWARVARYVMILWFVGYPWWLIQSNDTRGPVPLSKTRDRVPFGVTAAVRDQRAVLTFLPASTCVEAANTLVPHLTSRNYVSLAGVQNWRADFIVLDMSAADIGGNPPAPTPSQVQAEALTHGYREVLQRGSFVVLQSPSYSGPSSQCGPLGTGKASTSR